MYIGRRWRFTAPNRSRYEVANNCYAKGIVLTLANDVIGTGPRLQMLTDDPVANRQIERAFMRWAKPNSRRLRERQTFTELMQAVESTDPDEATFYAHSKGVASLGNPQGVMYWRNAMYHALLDDWEAVHAALLRFPIVGTHRRKAADHHAHPDGTRSCWHFAGTFFWFRNAEAFSRADWNSSCVLPETGWAVEAWPGRMFDIDQSWCVDFERIANAYDPASYADPIPDPEISPPKQANLKIELGGGKTPRGNGFVNLDEQPGVMPR